MLQSGDVLRVDRPGGGGFGPPSARDPERAEADLADGYVMPAATGLAPGGGAQGSEPDR